MSTTGYIYTLNDPRTDEPMYVGATKHPHDRLQKHIRHPKNDELAAWVEELEAEGLSPDMALIDFAPISDLGEREEELINELSGRFELLNQTSVSSYPGSVAGKTAAVRVPLPVYLRAKSVKKERSFATIGEAIRHMCQEGGFDV